MAKGARHARGGGPRAVGSAQSVTSSVRKAAAVTRQQPRHTLTSCRRQPQAHIGQQAAQQPTAWPRLCHAATTRPYQSTGSTAAAQHHRRACTTAATVQRQAQRAGGRQTALNTILVYILCSALPDPSMHRCTQAMHEQSSLPSSVIRVAESTKVTHMLLTAKGREKLPAGGPGRCPTQPPTATTITTPNRERETRTMPSLSAGGSNRAAS